MTDDKDNKFKWMIFGGLVLGLFGLLGYLAYLKSQNQMNTLSQESKKTLNINDTSQQLQEKIIYQPLYYPISESNNNEHKINEITIQKTDKINTEIPLMTIHEMDNKEENKRRQHIFGMR